ncbi:hypothetical protein GGR50DRAFT_575763 [Xylaria sp. CBS 124048]|nr:hypothetical protein GGR50DRAFT_575763 [Xylaria sp. CBS 124048]
MKEKSERRKHLFCVCCVYIYMNLPFFLSFFSSLLCNYFSIYILTFFFDCVCVCMCVCGNSDFVDEKKTDTTNPRSEITRSPASLKVTCFLSFKNNLLSLLSSSLLFFLSRLLLPLLAISVVTGLFFVNERGAPT